jgi:hypothetical protein
MKRFMLFFALFVILGSLSAPAGADLQSVPTQKITIYK